MIWYPAAGTGDALPVVFSEYAFTPPEEQDMLRFLAGIQDREIGFLYQVFTNNELAVLEALSTEMKAVMNADHADGVFPLLLYHSAFNRGIAENAVMYEYLASNGFVVAATHSFGLTAVRGEPDAAGLETMVGDMEFAIAALHDLDFIDHDKLGVFGYRNGADAALLLQMRSYNIDAVVEIEPALRDTALAELATGNPYYDTARMTVPLLELYSIAEDGREEVSVEPFRYGPRTSVGFRNTRGFDFTTYGLFPAMFLPPDTTGAPTSNAAVYEAACGYVLNFFDAYLNGTEASLEFLAGSPSAKGLDPDQVVLTSMEAVERPPSQDEFMAILTDGEVETAVEIFQKFRAAEPDLVLFREAVMNGTGYRYLQRGMPNEAVELFKMNAYTYPQSANCWDSLTEAYIAAGDNQRALECVEMVLEVLPTDENLGDDLRQALESNAQRYKEILTEEQEESTQEDESVQE
jgi:dienelactone hydrolase